MIGWLGLLFASACSRSTEPLDPADDWDFVDGPEGRVRVHFSRGGPNAVDVTDDDEDGVPDAASDVARSTEDTLRLYAFLGLAPPATEAEVGLDEPGGSDALDVYLLESTGAHVDRCVGRRCATHLVLPASGGPVDVQGVVARAVLDGYDGTGAEPDWLVESGVARLRDIAYGDDAFTFAWDPDAYLAHTDCGLDEIDGSGACADAAEGVGLLWWYLDDQVGDDVLWRTIEHTVELDGQDALDAALAEHGTSLSEQWPEFSSYNLATGPRGDGRGGYGYWFNWIPEGMAATAEGASIQDSSSFAPLSARAYRIDHAGGELWLGTAGDAGDLVVSVHPVVDGEPDGPLSAGTDPVAVPSDGAIAIGEFPAGGVWVLVSHPGPGKAVRPTLCVGSSSNAVPCDASGCRTVPSSFAMPWWLAAFVRRRQNPAPPKTR